MSDIYVKLQQKIDQVGVGFPATEQGFELEVLKSLFTEQEAELVVAMKEGGLYTAKEHAEYMKEDEKEIAEKLYKLSRDGLIFRVRDGEEVKYSVAAVVQGFYEFSLSRFTPEVGKAFSKHYSKGLGARFFGGSEPVFRVIPINTEVTSEKKVLPFDNAVEMIKKQELIAVTDCFCRLTARVGPKGGCDHRLETCVLFNNFARYYLENEMARKITVDEAISIITQSEADGLVLEVSNAENIEVMCSCCSCCCGVMTAARYFPGPANEKISNYVCVKNEELCINCGVCTTRCITKAHKADESGKVTHQSKKCIGCGLCVSTCSSKALTLKMKESNEIYKPPRESWTETYQYIADQRTKSTTKE